VCYQTSRSGGLNKSTNAKNPSSSESQALISIIKQDFHMRTSVLIDAEC
jgi:hypothetical protein